MQAFPHHYTVRAAGFPDGDVELSADRVSALRSAPPAEFDGPGDRWSPETLVTGAVADCFILTFRAVARASKLPWTSLRCEAIGTLDRLDRVTQFTAFTVRAHLLVPADSDRDAALRALEKAERNCLIANSLKAAVHLDAEVELLPTMAMTA
jgi:organic hydroperoxide reductase OsmC/OhrA